MGRWAKKLGIVFLGAALLSPLAQAKASDCGQLSQQLLAMQRAQASLLTSMVNKNESLAMVLDNYARDFETEDRHLKKSDIENLHGSAQAFRAHRERERQLVERFARSSQELIMQTNACLAGNSRPSEDRKISQTVTN